MTAAERRRLSELADALGGEVSFERPLAELTTWRVGGPAEAVFAPAGRAALSAAVALAEAEGWRCRVIGNGSNLLCPDDGVRGLVLHLAGALTGVRFEGPEIEVEAGAFLPKLARQAGARGLSGLEGLVGVPGTIGGGCVMNAGVPSGTLGDVLVEVEVLRPGGAVERWTVEELALGHRESRLQHEPGIVLSARLRLAPGDPAEIAARMDEHMAYRRRTQPLTLPTCGSVFRRPAEGYPGQLLEEAGCKGLRRGDAEVSSLHANWIVNLGGARAEDIRWLMDEMRRRVRERTGIELVPEVIVWESDR